MNRKKLIKKIEDYDFYLVNVDMWSDDELKGVYKKLKKEGRIAQK